MIPPEKLLELAAAQSDPARVSRISRAEGCACRADRGDGRDPETCPLPVILPRLSVALPLEPTTPYSPDLNPSEIAVSKLKALSRKVGARTFDAIWAAPGDICVIFEPE